MTARSDSLRASPAGPVLPVAEAGQADLHAVLDQPVPDPVQGETAILDGGAQRGMEGACLQQTVPFGANVGSS